MPAERYISQLPDYESFGQQTKLHLNPRNIPDFELEMGRNNSHTGHRQGDSEPYFSLG